MALLGAFTTAFGNFLLYAMINTGRFPLMVFGYVVTFVILLCIGFGALSAVFAYVCVMLLVLGGCLAVLTRQVAAASLVGAGSASSAGSSTGSPGRVETT